MRKFLSALACCTIASSCVMLDLKTAETSDASKIAFELEWDALAEDARPDTVFVAMNRVSDVIRYAFELDASGNYLPDNDHDSSAVYGNYIMLAYTRDRDNYDFSGPDSFISEPKVSMKDFKASLKELPLDELDALREGSNLDFNAAYRFVRHSVPLWSASRKGDVSDTRENAFRFTMRPMLQDITFAVNLEAESGVDIVSVVAEVSGVPASISLLTGAVDVEDMARVIFRMSPSGEHRYEGTVGIPGLFPSGNASLYTGPGIMRLSVTAEMNGVRKVLRPAMNIGDLITSSSLMERIPGTDDYRISRRTAVLEVSGHLIIGAGSFSSSGSGSGSVEGWFDSDNIDVEI